MTGELTVAWFNCQAGVAGDMTMAALIDAGADSDVVASTIGGLGVGRNLSAQQLGYKPRLVRSPTGGISQCATQAGVAVKNLDGAKQLS